MGLGLLGCLVLALAGGVALGASGVIAVVLAGAVAACLATGIAREVPGPRRWAPLEAAVQAAAGTIGVLLVLSGIAALAGGLVATVVASLGAVAALAVWLMRTPDRRPRAGTRRPPAPARAPDPLRPSQPLPPVPWHAAPPAVARPEAAGGARLLPPVCDLPTDALGREWTRTTAALAGRLEPAARSSIVARRQDALDELERRDPAGFARWLAAGPLPGSDPASYVDGGPGAGREAA
jgi:hypothetical protein